MLKWWDSGMMRRWDNKTLSRWRDGWWDADTMRCWNDETVRIWNDETVRWWDADTIRSYDKTIRYDMTNNVNVPDDWPCVCIRFVSRNRCQYIDGLCEIIHRYIVTSKPTHRQLKVFLYFFHGAFKIVGSECQFFFCQLMMGRCTLVRWDGTLKRWDADTMRR